MYCFVILHKNLAGENKFFFCLLSKSKNWGLLMRAVIIWFYVPGADIDWENILHAIKNVLYYFKDCTMQVSK